MAISQHDLDADPYAALHYFLQAVLHDVTGVLSCDASFWMSIIEASRTSKTPGLLCAGVRNTGADLPPAIQERLSSLRSEILRTNLVNLAIISEISGAFSHAGIPFLVFKGPLRAQQVYASADYRYGSDVDILVSQSDYRRSMTLLREIGYQCLVDDRDAWWHDCLGESPFLKKDGRGPSIDLHNQLQQPGGPYPNGISDFIEMADTFPIGTTKVKVPKPSHALMITAISYGKALRAGDPWIQYAHEFAAVWLKSSANEKADAVSTSQAMGLNRLFDQFSAHSLTLFGAGQPGLISKDQLEEFQLLQSAFGNRTLGNFERTLTTWNWMSGNWITRPLLFLGALKDEVRSRLARRRSPEIQLPL